MCHPCKPDVLLCDLHKTRLTASAALWCWLSPVLPEYIADVRASEPAHPHAVAMTADVPDRLGRTPLHDAALDGPVEQVMTLLADGADVATTDRQGFTPLHFACQQYRAEVVEVLLDAGAQVDPVTLGNTPLLRAVFNAKGDPSIVRRLVRTGADPDHANASGRSPRELAGTIGNYNTAGFFDTTA